MNEVTADQHKEILDVVEVLVQTKTCGLYYQALKIIEMQSRSNA